MTHTWNTQSLEGHMHIRCQKSDIKRKDTPFMYSYGTDRIIEISSYQTLMKPLRLTCQIDLSFDLDWLK